MNYKKQRVGITLRVTDALTYNEKRDSLSQDWPQFLESINIIPVYLPNKFSDIESYIDELGLDGIILSGGDNIGDHPERDNVENKMIKICVQTKKPIFGVCRGMQVLNKFFDGSISIKPDSEHVNKRHKIKFNEMFSNWFKDTEVNSFHNNIITNSELGNELTMFAAANDGTIEGFYHNSLPIIGVMWHPERDANSFNQKFLKKFFSEQNFWQI